MPNDSMQLTLLRHGLAEPAAAGGDFARELDARGVAQARAAALALQHAGLPLPDCILSSPALRTRQTAMQVVQTLALDEASLQLEQRLYLASAETLLDVVRNLHPAARHVLLVGHNPGLSDLALRLGAVLPAGELATGELCLLPQNP